MTVQPRWAVGAAVTVFAGMAVHNAVWIAINQRDLPREERPHLSPRSIEQVAALDPHRLIGGRVAVFYFIAEHLAGRRVEIPRWLANTRWLLEHVGRIEVVVGGSNAVDPAQVEALRRAATARRPLLRSGGSDNAIFQDLYLIADDAERDYVLAETTPRGPLFLLPRPLFRSVAASRRGRAP